MNWNEPRYWYHLSRRHLGDRVKLVPMDGADSRNEMEPDGNRICVAPTIAHCLVAIPRTQHELFVYSTTRRRKAIKARGVFDAPVTKEGWFLRPTSFTYLGSISMMGLSQKLDELEFCYDPACEDDINYDLSISKKALKIYESIIANYINWV